MGSTRPLHITRMMRTFGAYLMRAEPARSAARYEHQLQRKPTIFGSKVSLVIVIGQLSVVELSVRRLSARHAT